MITGEKKEAYPLFWPEDWPRTRVQDQKPMRAWKLTANQYREKLAIELERMGSPSAVISSNVPLNLRGGLTTGVEPADVGVAVYFLRASKPDFTWQEALEIHEPAPSDQRIQDAFRRKAQIYHPDRGGDAAMFAALVRHRDNALRWIDRGREGQNFNQVLAADQFNEVRLNMAAIVLTIRAIRQIERCGTSALLERAWKGFAAITEKASA